MPADNRRFCLFAEILVGTPIGIWHWPTSRPSTKRPCNPSRFGEGELYGIVSQLAFSYPLMAMDGRPHPLTHRQLVLLRASLFQPVYILTTTAHTGDGAVDCRARRHPARYARPSDGSRPGCRVNPPNTVSTSASMYASESGALSYGTRIR
jgi:hypothetical protein